jgi:hypothetical protein
MAFQYLSERTPYNAMSRYRGHRIVEIDGFRTSETWKAPVITPQPTDQFYRVQAGEVNRLGLIAQKFYGSRQLWWVIALANQIHDPVAEIEVNTELRIPNRRYLFETILAV